MSQIIWNAEHGWHETDDTYKLTLDYSGRFCTIKWVIVDSDDDSTLEKERKR